jgi:hypothetical protein
MSSLHKPTVIAYRTSDGKPCRKGEPGAHRFKGKAQKWYGQYRNAEGKVVRVPLDKDKEVARRKLVKLVQEAKDIEDGIADPFKVHRATPLAEHLEAYHRSLQARGNCAEYVEMSIARVKAVLDGCGFARLSDLSGGRVMEFLADLRRPGRDLQNVTHRPAISIGTSNGYLTAVKGFSKWLAKDRRAAFDVLGHLSLMNGKTDIRRRRRALSSLETQWLLDTTGHSPFTLYGLSGPSRFILYVVAMVPDSAPRSWQALRRAVSTSTAKRLPSPSRRHTASDGAATCNRYP